jgi:hypothetical protein
VRREASLDALGSLVKELGADVNQRDDNEFSAALTLNWQFTVATVI